jgi:Protein of unknown function (DUF3455)
MHSGSLRGLAILLLGSIAGVSNAAAAETAAAKWSAGLKTKWKLHAVGAQIYECKAVKPGELAWQFREPIATLLNETVTVGHHNVGPEWVVDGVAYVKGKVVESMPGETADDIPQLRLAVTSTLNDVTAVLRVDTRGGKLEGACNTAGALRAVPYSADYIFLEK